MTPLPQPVEPQSAAPGDPEARPLHQVAQDIERGLSRVRSGLEDLLGAMTQAQQDLGALERTGGAGPASRRRAALSLRDLNRRQAELRTVLGQLRSV